MHYIYKITNNINDKIYIGRTKNIKQRFNKHMSELLDGKHHSVYLQRFFNKNPDALFSIDVLFEFLSFDDCCDKEYELINTLDNLFNVSKESTGGDLISLHPYRSNIILKMKESLRIRYLNPDERAKYSKPLAENPNWKNGITKNTICPTCGNYKYYKSTRCKVCNEKDRKGEKNSFYGKTHSKETLNKIKKTKILNQKILKHSLPNNTCAIEYDGKKYESATSLSKILGCTPATILNRCRSDKFSNYKLFQEKFNDQ